MITVMLLVLGLVIGSFLGALSYRLPRGIDINHGRSFCETCKKQIRWYDNIPLLSYLILGGKCRDCHKKISPREPLIELASAIIFVFVGFNIINLILAAILITIFVIDLEHQIIPDELVYIGIFVLILSFLISNNQLIFVNLLAGFISALILLFLNIVTDGKGMGLGDVKLALLIGSIVGINLFFVWLLYSFVSGAIVGIILIITKKATLKYKIAFGPFLIIGLVLTIYFGNSLFRLMI